MINNYYLSGLEDSCVSNKILVNEFVNEQDTPKIYMFINNIDLFYKQYCKSFDCFKLREKRLLDFETPNRALITHEYDIDIDGEFEYGEYYYLFNPMQRLSWLKITQDGKRLPIAKESYVKDYIKGILDDELSSISVNFEKLWETKEGFPCFVKLEETTNGSLLITASYYDSIRSEGKENISVLSPLMERRIKYNYLPLEGKSSWLYIKAPNNFNVRCNPKPISSQSNNLDLGTPSGGIEADPGKISLTIINTPGLAKLNTVTLSFDISVPCSLKFWFMSIYYISIIVSVLLFLTCLNELWLIFLDPIINCQSLYEILFSKTKFEGVVMGIIAAIITTRSWLISEETITKYYSIYITIIMITILIFYTIIMICM